MSQFQEERRCRMPRRRVTHGKLFSHSKNFPDGLIGDVPSNTAWRIRLKATEVFTLILIGQLPSVMSSGRGDWGK
jgi:hypothetical protein